MSADHPRLEKNLLAALDDQAAIETRTLEEVRYDLAELGIDPQGAIRRVQDRARGRGNPQSGLEEEAIELGRESPEPAEPLVHQDEVTDQGVTAIAAKAGQGAGWKKVDHDPKGQSEAGHSERVVAFKGRKRRLLGWGGSIIGLAACLLVFVLIRPDLRNLEMPSGIGKDNGDVVQPNVAAPLSGFAREGGSAGPETADPFATLAETEPQWAERSLSEPPARAADADGEARANPASPTLASPLDTGNAGAGSVTASRLPATVEPSGEVFADDIGDLLSSGGRDEIHALLIVDFVSAPVTLLSKAGALPTGGLAGRLREAQDLVGDRQIIALVTLRREGRDVDAVVLGREGAAISSGFELIDLPKQP